MQSVHLEPDRGIRLMHEQYDTSHLIMWYNDYAISSFYFPIIWFPIQVNRKYLILKLHVVFRDPAVSWLKVKRSLWLSVTSLHPTCNTCTVKVSRFFYNVYFVCMIHQVNDNFLLPLDVLMLGTKKGSLLQVLSMTANLQSFLPYAHNDCHGLILGCQWFYLVSVAYCQC